MTVLLSLLLKSKILDNENARNMMELVPAMRELVNDFYAGKYGPCLSFLDSYQQRLNLDLYFSDHVGGVIQKIKENSILQYFSAFVAVKLPVMATALNLTVEQLDRDDTVLKSYVFRAAYPLTVAAIELTNAEATEIETFEVTWRYQHFEPSGVL